MKRILTILAATLLLTAAMAGTASASSYDSVAEELSAIGVFRGTAGGFELDRAPTRSEAAIMLVRLYGAEDEAKAAYEAGEISMPFTDVSETAAPSVAWLYSQGITNGTSATTFGASSPCSAKMYCAFLLRALGYEDGVDFLYGRHAGLRHAPRPVQSLHAGRRPLPAGRSGCRHLPGPGR
ncbi:MULTISPECIES: S-layer homology domain-containing protein [unclassified Oscillibacter]|uniref:S-layer homology domain-containing protein n=1 Tax=unclassified Oscillibacter TaxID=2629304 RepID=UPI0005673F27|nr:MULTISPECIES: S-layer homology domain-containing protein [unclassified Oscillibacter]